MEKLILIGGGGHCKSCIETIESSGKYTIEGILDVEEKVGSAILGYKVIGTDNDISKFSDHNFLITIGQIKNNTARLKVYDLLKKLNCKLPVILASTAYVSERATIAEGTIIMHQAMVNADAKIGVNCIINNKALIEHDVVIGNHCHISTAAVINGGVNIGDHVFVGSGAVTKEYISIESNSFIKANSIIK